MTIKKVKTKMNSKSNLKFYSITKRSSKFVSDYLIQNCSGKKVLDYRYGNGETTTFWTKHSADVKRNRPSFYENDYFDLIFCNGVLRHLDIEKAYAELVRVLKPNGKIICFEPLEYNPVFYLYKKMTPHLRTRWGTKYILKRADIRIARRYFGKVETRFFNLAVLMAVPFRRLPGFNLILGLLGAVDSVLLKMPGLKWLAWDVVFILSEPAKEKPPFNRADKI